MITDAIKDAFDQFFSGAWEKIWNIISFSFLDPFWGWLSILVCLYVAVMLICYFFGSYFPILRVIGGTLLVIATFGLVAYRKGESDAREHDR